MVPNSPWRIEAALNRGKLNLNCQFTDQAGDSSVRIVQLPDFRESVLVGARRFVDTPNNIREAARLHEPCTLRARTSPRHALELARGIGRISREPPTVLVLASSIGFARVTSRSTPLKRTPGFARNVATSHCTEEMTVPSICSYPAEVRFPSMR
jgi:hypothetical protein